MTRTDGVKQADYSTSDAHWHVDMASFAVDSRPGGDAWKDAFHWYVVLRRGGRIFATYYSAGSAHKELRGDRWHATPPTVADMLGCLSSDVRSLVDGETFEDWASEFGYDTDSAKARKAYDTIAQHAKELESLFDATDALPNQWAEFLAIEY